MIHTQRMPTMDTTTMDSSTSQLGFATEESAGSGAEGRAPRKRLQRAANAENDDPLRKSGMSLPFQRPRDAIAAGGPAAAQQNESAKMNMHARRRSTLRENNRPLLGPRPLESKRVISDHAPPARLPTSQLPTSTGDHSLSSGVNTRYSFTKLRESNQSRESTGSQDFLPSVSFDDFHASLASIDPDLVQFPVPGGDITTAASRPRLDSPSKLTLPDGKPNLGQSVMERGTGRGSSTSGDASKVARSSSLARRFSNARRNLDQSSSADTAAMPPPAAPAAGGRSRRQSSITSNPGGSVTSAPTTTARPPRKSVGPGLLSQGLEERRAAREAQAGAGSVSRTSSMNKGVRRETLGHQSGSGPDLARLAQPRNPRTKSLQPPPRGQSSNHLSATPVSGSSATPNPVSPARSTTHRSHTPSSSTSKRQSIHVGGLGARTISPTDARRLKRLSTAGKLPVPQAPPTPQPDTLPGLHLSNHVQLAGLRNKTATPSSARNTPDLVSGKKGGFTGQIPVLSSSSSYSSLRAPNGGASSRNSQIMQGSRIPTPKPRNVHSSAGFQEEEEVPPVPAIPKAFESPKDIQNGESYFGARKSQKVEGDELKGSVSKFSIDAGRAGSKIGGRPSMDVSELTTLGQDRGGVSVSAARHRRGLTVGSGDHGEKAPQPSAALNKKNLQPLRLPPLNLLPLSMPTAARIANFHGTNLDTDERQHATPPPKRNYTKTPSTPMTASKATFFTKNGQEYEDDAYDLFKRSASSIHLVDHSASRSLGLSPTTPVAIPSPFPRNNARTPFASSSLPKPAGDFGPLGNTSEQEMHPQQLDSNKPTDANTAVASPKPQTLLIKKEAPSARTSTSDEPSTPASTSSNLRRKLSLSWKRSSSKASQRAKAEKAEAEKAEKEAKEEAKRASKQSQKDMPPPKLPASSGWNGNFSPTITESSSRPSFERFGRKASGSASIKDASLSEAFSSIPDLKPTLSNDPPSTYNEQRRMASRSTSSSVLTPMQRILGTKSSLGTLKARHLDTNLDKDDLAADRIMEKMGSKRKDFEQAARELDELRRRAVPREKLTAQQATQCWDLNIFERGEIIDYKEVYFYGTKNARKHVGDLNHATNNFGYDDDRGDYNIVLGDHLAYRYEVVDMLGKGSFGQVVRCIDHKTGMLVAIKIIRNKKRFHQQALVEVNILQKLREWDPDNKHSMINFTQSFYFRGHLCISTELLGMNLYEFIKAYEFKGFPLPLIRRFTKQMLSSLCLLKSKRVIHCDLKPENILLAHPMHSEIKVIDFGSSCFEHEKVYTYIQSRFYRSPEVILGMSYGIPIDMWSLGCILAELLTGYPIFPGENEQEQLACIMEIFGPPEKHLIEKSSRKKLFFDSMGKPRVTVSSKGRRRRPSSKTLQQVLKCDDEAFLDFIQRCLRWDPDRRLKPDEAMQHEFITGVKRTAPARTRVAQGTGPTATSSPVKRFNTVHQTPRSKAQQEGGGARPLPEPPATSYRNGAGVPAPSTSPVKGGTGRRHSTFTAGQSTTGAKGSVEKRTVTGTTGLGPSASGLPRVAQGGISQGRSVSGKPDLASAAAAASLGRSQQSRL
ncbi:uncharacterized protein PV09_05314 [Verruconis gallopava]|uniref:Protein kinase domain-containing protein n=1 Tax=Verruconis gallopava TaxID=253628 RepID=A0A0D2AWN4_9PEZI|nr:uncharacterized protein PV09_05314 [Verruconis gallopava]KIW03554.1 hypothetical protein PV09_05314 [Verruconis gallopava]